VCCSQHFQHLAGAVYCNCMVSCPMAHARAWGWRFRMLVELLNLLGWAELFHSIVKSPYDKAVTIRARRYFFACCPSLHVHVTSFTGSVAQLQTPCINATMQYCQQKHCSDASPCLTLLVPCTEAVVRVATCCLRTAPVCWHLAPGTAILCALHSGRKASTAMAQAIDTESFEFSFNKEVFSDCTVVVTAAEGTKGRKRSWGGLFRSGAERAEFFVTKALLARASPVFRSMIEEQGREQRGGKTVLHLSVPSSEDFGFVEAMLRHVYTKKLSLSAGTAPALLSCTAVTSSLQRTARLAQHVQGPH